ncbi:MAG: 4Fe-4S binding protein [Bilophila wadsworthia]
MVDETRCIACGSCMRACPYQARHIDPARRVVDKCDYCAPSRAEAWNPPASAYAPPAPACLGMWTTTVPGQQGSRSHKVTFVEAEDAPTSRPSPI